MNKANKNENIVVYIMYAIIGIVIISVIFVIIMSNKNLFDNNSILQEENINNQSLENEENTNDNSSVTSNKDNKEDINIKKPEKTNQPATKETPVETELSSYTTTLYDKEQTRIENIKLAISKLNGKTIDNNVEFSFNNTIGPMNENNGFKKATGFDSNGKKIKISGGGICQISSTLYNTALMAGFTITERHPHSKRVYYVPKDKDATIFYGSLDLKFINTSGTKVRIDASCTNSTVTIKLIKIS